MDFYDNILILSNKLTPIVIKHIKSSHEKNKKTKNENFLFVNLLSYF